MQGRAGEILAGRYTLLGYEVELPSPPRWRRDFIHGRESELMYLRRVPESIPEAILLARELAYDHLSRTRTRSLSSFLSTTSALERQPLARTPILDSRNPAHLQTTTPSITIRP